jgi:L-rhamnose mutarotase
MKRFGQIIRLKSEKLSYYRELHANPWPCVLEKIRECNIRNYSIYLYQDNTLFAYFEYTGLDFQADMKRMADDECTQRWWNETAPCQESLGMSPGEWWLNMEEVFHCE